MRGAVTTKARRKAVAEAHAKREQGVLGRGANAFIQKFELVHAAWEVFEQDGDEAELSTRPCASSAAASYAQMAALVRDQEDPAAAAAQTVAGGMGPSDGGFYDDEGGATSS